jgi:23S rRNA pseudouridine955/2504/2580 synthase
VHRLDKETAGCLVVARSPRAAAELSGLMGGRGAVKTYRAVVSGSPEPASGTYRDDVRVRGEELSAETRYATVMTDGRLSLVEAELGTGRNHQIRRHFAMAGHPIVGDDRHGDFRLNKVLAKELGAKRLMLYACRILLPLTPPVEASASVPPHFAAFLERWGRGDGA